MSLSKNIGQVSGIYIGTSAPDNKTLIWYDSTPAIQAHKVYNYGLSAWVMLDNSVISDITYSELVGIASGTGLTQGAWYKITDEGDVLALAITSTKVQYVDINGNFIIDDLVATVIYVVNSNNLYIDDEAGVWDDENNKLKFDFDAVSLDADSANDYVFGKRTRNGITSLVKYTLQGLISSVSGNSIMWNEGYYFNFLSQLASQMDVAGGVVSKNSFDSALNNIQVDYSNLVNSVNQTFDNLQNSMFELTNDVMIYSKKMPYNLTPATATDIIIGDTLATIVQKVQRWINRFKLASGADIDNNFTPVQSESSIISGDSVFTAFRKVQKAIENRKEEINILNNFQFTYLHQGVAKLRLRIKQTLLHNNEDLFIGFCVSNSKLFEQTNTYPYIDSSLENGALYSFADKIQRHKYGTSSEQYYQFFVFAPVVRIVTNVLYLQIFLDISDWNMNWAYEASGNVFSFGIASRLSQETPAIGVVNPAGGIITLKVLLDESSSIWQSSGGYTHNILMDLKVDEGA